MFVDAERIKLFRLTGKAPTEIFPELGLQFEINSGFLYFVIRQKPDQRFIVKIDNLNAIAPRIAEIAAKRRDEFDFIFVR